MRIYNLFPRLAGPFSAWRPHLERAADLGFNWIFVNPIQQPGRSQSLYSIKDYFKINPIFLDPNTAKSPEDQIRETLAWAEGLGLRVMQDLVINHCAYDSPLVKRHPEWFLKEKGRIAHPFCLHEGKKVVWKDLASFDHRHTSDPEGLYRYCRAVVEHLLALGFKGFRCDAAYQIPREFWQRLIEETKRAYPEVIFVAETLGCSVEQTRETTEAGFDYIFNSAKWWDFESPWLLEQYNLTREIVPSIAFPESHDTPRLFAESRSVDALKQRYLFAALFSAGVMMPIGYEFGFQKPLHVIDTKPQDWEETEVDLCEFIRKVNGIKSRYRVFQEESVCEVLDHLNPAVLLMWKAAARDHQEALIILNKNVWGREQFYTEDLYRYIQSSPPLVDVSPEWTQEYLPTPYHFELAPGMGRVLVAGV
jgi:starch synthase (maltosyl-transferring)